MSPYFMADRALSEDAIMFCQLTDGFLMPNIFIFLNKLSVEKLIIKAYNGCDSSFRALRVYLPRLA